MFHSHILSLDFQIHPDSGQSTLDFYLCTSTHGIEGVKENHLQGRPLKGVN
jgi:hypothetical protein